MGRRRGNFSRALRSRRKFLTVWVLLLSLAGYQWTKRFCAVQPEGDCSQVVADLSDLALQALGILVCLGLFALLLIRRRRASRPEDYSSGFRNEPWNFDHSWIRVSGKIEKVFTTNWQTRLRRSLIHTFRSAIGNRDPEGRHLHQAFLISSPQLRRGEKLLVRHNTKFGKVGLRAGAWIEAQGEYVHRPSDKRTAFGTRKTYYGMLHYTHKPRGHLVILDGAPQRLMEIERLRFREDLSGVEADEIIPEPKD